MQDKITTIRQKIRTNRNKQIELLREEANLSQELYNELNIQINNLLTKGGNNG